LVTPILDRSWVIANGIFEGARDTLTPLEICSSMTDPVVAPQGIELEPYVAIVDGRRRHNMAKVYS